MEASAFIDNRLRRVDADQFFNEFKCGHLNFFHPSEDTWTGGFANHAVNFYKNPNWKDGLEMTGQLGVWGLKIAFPESYVIDAVEFGYNNGTMIVDTIWDANHKK